MMPPGRKDNRATQELGTIVTLDPTGDDDWLTLVAAGESDVFHSPEWLRTISSTYGFEIGAQVLVGESGPMAGLPYAVVDGIGGTRVVSFPFSDYCDPLVSSLHEWKRLTGGLLEHGLATVIRCLHNAVPLADERFAVTNKAHWHAVDLRPDGDDPWEHLASSARRAIRKSRSANVDVAAAETPAELRAFYDLHLRVRKTKYRLLAQPFAFFENLWREFVENDRGTLMVARVGGELAAGVMFLEWKDRLYYKLNASQPEFSATRPNDAIMWAGIEYGRARGHRRLDLGLSDWDQEGLVRYKRKYASEEKVISFLSHHPQEPTPSEPTRLAQLMPGLTDLLTDERVPDEITERAGDALYRFFA